VLWHFITTDAVESLRLVAGIAVDGAGAMLRFLLWEDYNWGPPLWHWLQRSLFVPLGPAVSGVLVLWVALLLGEYPLRWAMGRWLRAEAHRDRRER
jgi:hypothetical protein